MCDLAVRLIEQVHTRFPTLTFVVAPEANYGGWPTSQHIYDGVRQRVNPRIRLLALQLPCESSKDLRAPGFMNMQTEKRYAALAFGELLDRQPRRVEFVHGFVTSKENGKMYLLNQLRNLENRKPTEREEMDSKNLSYSGKRNNECDDCAIMLLAATLLLSTIVANPQYEGVIPNFRAHRIPPTFNARLRWTPRVI